MKEERNPLNTECIHRALYYFVCVCYVQLTLNVFKIEVASSDATFFPHIFGIEEGNIHSFTP